MHTFIVKDRVHTENKWQIAPLSNGLNRRGTQVPAVQKFPKGVRTVMQLGCQNDLRLWDFKNTKIIFNSLNIKMK